MEKPLTNLKTVTSKENIRTLERKKKKLQNNKDYILFNQTSLHTHTHTHTHTHIYIYIYIYIYCQHFLVNKNSIKHIKHFMPTYILLDPFEFPYYFYRIQVELIYVLSIVVCIPNTFCPTLSHHQGRIYFKSDVTFVLAYYYYVRASLPLKIMAFAFKWVSIISVSS